MSKLDEAITFASIAHAGQRRACGRLPYIIHPINVMTLVSSVEHGLEMLMAAVLHDVIEDTQTTMDTIERRFGSEVLLLVTQLTNTSGGTRDERKAANLERLALITSDAATIKLADIIDNLRTVRKDKPDFAQEYLMEKIAQYDVLAHGDKNMRLKTAEAIVNAM